MAHRNPPAPLSAVDRRALLRALLMTGCAAGCCAAGLVPATAARPALRRGCIVLGSKAANGVLGASTLASAQGSGPEEVRRRLRSSGDAAFDRAFDAALQRLAQTFDVWPKVGFYDDGDEPNALAMAYSEQGKPTYAVLFGINYVRSMQRYDPSGITLLQTAAHEFAHVWGFRTGVVDRLVDGQPSVKRAELHADFMSGYYLGLRKRDHPTASFRDAGVRRWQSGDTQFRSQHHHGTPEQRLAAAEAGFHVGFTQGAGAGQAFAAATRFVEAL